MQWLSVGSQGSAFRAQVETSPGWYWVYRPLNLGPQACDPDRGVVLPIYVHPDGRVGSPLTDLRNLAVDALLPMDRPSGRRFLTFYAGPIAPGPLAGTLEKRPGQPLVGTLPTPGWHWCRTVAPLAHTDPQGIGPVLLAERPGHGLWVYPAAFADGAPCDVFELGFAEPLVSEGGLIDESGAVGRYRAELHGSIPTPPELPGRFPLVGGG